MCVIMLASEGKRPSDQMVEDGYATNPKGAGVAWRETKSGRPLVRWEKGLDLQEAKKLIAEVPLPMVAHFRVDSCGGALKSLTHPFPIREDVPLTLSGESSGSVLFHNGHWTGWEFQVKDVAIRGAFKIPPGKWTDTRALAWMAFHLGSGILEFIDEKVVVFGPKEMLIFGKGWTKGQEGLWLSNTYWRGAASKGEARSHRDWHETKGAEEKVTTLVEPDGRLPTAYRGRSGAAAKHDRVLAGIAEAAKQESGGTPPEIPFVFNADVLARFELAFKAGRISKKKLKKYRRIFDRQEMVRRVAQYREEQKSISAAQERLTREAQPMIH